LQNYLAARVSGGEFILRIDNTDSKRNIEEFNLIFKSVSSLGLPWDCSFEQTHYIYDHEMACVFLNENGYTREDAGASFLSQKAVDLLGDSFFDIACGVCKITEQDKENVLKTMLVRSNGKPTYHLASVVDDIYCGTNLILRGIDHLSNTPKHLAIALALKECKWSFADRFIDNCRWGHSGLVCKDNKKLSKRDNESNFSEILKDNNPEVIRHWLLQMGWGHPDSNFDKNNKKITDSQMQLLFKEGKINPKNCELNLDKLKSLNSLYSK
jgi:glutamyl-tRNA synthetase